MGYSSEKHSVSSCCWMAVCACVCVRVRDFGKSREVSGIYMITEAGPEPDQSRADASAVSVRETAPCNLVASKKVDIKCCISGYFLQTHLSEISSVLNNAVLNPVIQVAE